MFLGIDLGTSSVKAVLVDGAQSLVDEASEPLRVSRPRPLWSEQDPQTWWEATGAAVRAIRKRSGAALSGVRAIGLSGQMHGAVLLDRQGGALRPAILWNDGRSAASCAELERRLPGLLEITGNLAMPGFTAPKLVWVAENEPDVFAATAKVLLPKDYLRLRMTGAYASDVSDSSGTLWLDVRRRRWSDEALAATGLGAKHMPELFEGSAPSACLRADVANDWGMSPVPVAGGGGDQAAGAIGSGVIADGQALLSLGTSGVYFVACSSFRPNPDEGVHAFCHALPRTWHQMSVSLSAAASLAWLREILGARTEAELVAAAESHGMKSRVFFLPYLSGERTPHNDALAKGVFFGLDHETDRAAMVQAVLEGVAFALADGQLALLNGGTRIDEVSVIGGGSASGYWGRVLANVLGRSLVYREGARVGPAFGAARLARMAVTGEAPDVVCTLPAALETVAPDPREVERCRERHEIYRRLYRDLKAAFAAHASAS